MRISAAEEYGLRCLLTLARAGVDNQMSISEIAECEGLSVPYASKLMSQLRKADLVIAARGRTGGFCIARDPKDIDLHEIITAIGGPMIEPDHCRRFSGHMEECVHMDNCSVHEILGGLAGYVRQFLSRTSLQDLISRERSDNNRPGRSELVSAEELLSTEQTTGRLPGRPHTNKLSNSKPR
jgi:Rrf2 family protein